MINVSGLLANTIIDVYTTNTAKDGKGAITYVPVLKYMNIKAKLESKEVEAPISYKGASYRHYYLMHTWFDAQGNVYEIADQDIIIDKTNNKQYVAFAPPRPGSLMNKKPYKMETDLLVLADDRFINNQIPI